MPSNLTPEDVISTLRQFDLHDLADKAAYRLHQDDPPVTLSHSGESVQAPPLTFSQHAGSAAMEVGKPGMDTHGVPFKAERPNAEWQGLKKPSAVHHDDVYVVRLYRRAGGDAQVYNDVKHLWWTADSTVLTVLQYTNELRTEWRTIYWMREWIDWYTMTPQIFE